MSVDRRPRPKPRPRRPISLDRSSSDDDIDDFELVKVSMTDPVAKKRTMCRVSATDRPSKRRRRSSSSKALFREQSSGSMSVESVDDAFDGQSTRKSSSPLKRWTERHAGASKSSSRQPSTPASRSRLPVISRRPSCDPIVISEDEIDSVLSTPPRDVGRRNTRLLEAERETDSSDEDFTPTSDDGEEELHPEEEDEKNSTDATEQEISGDESLYDTDEERGLGHWQSEDREKLAGAYLAASDPNGTFDVERIIDFRAHPRKGYNTYRVKWKNYSDLYNSWEPAKMFSDRKAINAFWREYEKGGRKRPLTAIKKQEDAVGEEEAERDEEDTELEVSLSDAERSRAARKRKILDVRKDRAIVGGYRQQGCRNTSLIATSRATVARGGSSTAESSAGNSSETTFTRKDSPAATVVTSPMASATRKGASSTTIVNTRRASEPQSRLSVQSAGAGALRTTGRHSVPVPAPPALCTVNPRDFVTTSDAALTVARREDRQRQREIRDRLQQKEAKVSNTRCKEATASQSTRFDALNARSVRTSTILEDDEEIVDLASPPRQFSADDMTSADDLPTTPNVIGNRLRTNSAGYLSSAGISWRGQHHAPSKVKTLDGAVVGPRSLDQPPARAACKQYRKPYRNPLDVAFMPRDPLPSLTGSAVRTVLAQGILTAGRKDNSVAQGQDDSNKSRGQRRARFSPDELTPPVSDRNSPADTVVDEDCDRPAQAPRSPALDLSAGWGDDDGPDICMDDGNDPPFTEESSPTALHIFSRNLAAFEDPVSSHRTEHMATAVTSSNVPSTGWTTEQSAHTGVSKADGAAEALMSRDVAREAPYDPSGGWEDDRLDALPAELSKMDVGEQMNTYLFPARDCKETLSDAASRSRKARSDAAQPDPRGKAEAVKIPHMDSGISLVPSSAKSFDHAEPTTPHTVAASSRGSDAAQMAKDLDLHSVPVRRLILQNSDIIKDVKRSYHLILKLDDRDKERWKALRDELIHFVQFVEGGYKPEITDKMRMPGYKSVVWLPDFSLPREASERRIVEEAIMRSNFCFRVYTATGATHEVFPPGTGIVRMFTFGALMTRLRHICSAPTADDDRVDDEDSQVARYRNAWTSGGEANDTVQLHAWQRLALQSLIEAKLLHSFFEDIFGVQPIEARNIAISIIENGMDALAALEEVPIELTYGPQEIPLDAPDSLEKFANLDSLVYFLDGAVHKTLAKLQRRWCCERRGFLLMMEATGLLLDELDVCHAPLRVMVERKEGETGFSD